MLTMISNHRGTILAILGLVALWAVLSWLLIPDETNYKVQFCQPTTVNGLETEKCWSEWVPESELRQP